MADQPQQFFRDVQPDPQGTRLPGVTSIAIYTVPAIDGQTQPLTLAVEVVPGGSNLPQNATSVRDVVQKLDLAPELDAIVAMTNLALHKLKALQPGEVEIEFGVELGGEFGIPLVTKGEAKANFKVTLKWKNE